MSAADEKKLSLFLHLIPVIVHTNPVLLIVVYNKYSELAITAHVISGLVQHFTFGWNRLDGDRRAPHANVRLDKPMTNDPDAASLFPPVHPTTPPLVPSIPSLSFTT